MPSLGPWKIGRVHLADAVDALRQVPDASLDLIATDPPYGSTQNQWDRPVAWPEFLRESWCTLRPDAPIVALVDFRTAFAMHAVAVDEFRYEIVCPHNLPTGHLNAKIRPMVAHLFLVVLCSETPPWFPQMEFDPSRRNHSVGPSAPGTKRRGTTYGAEKVIRCDRSGWKYPTTVLPFRMVHARFREHASEKPVPLAEWILRSYTEPGAVVCDPFAGSGWVACASLRTGRRSISFDSDPTSVELANRRIATESERLGDVAAATASPSQQLGLLAGLAGTKEGGAS